MESAPNCEMCIVSEGHFMNDDIEHLQRSSSLLKMLYLFCKYSLMELEGRGALDRHFDDQCGTLSSSDAKCG